MLELDGLAIETGWWGPPPEQAPTLVLLHEGLGCVGLWRDFPATLAASTGCGVLAYSRFGYGRSAPVTLPRPLDYMHREAREVLPRVLDGAGIRRCVLVGHSDGGSIAAIHAGTFDDARVCGVVMIAAHFFVEQMTLDSIAAARTAFEQGDLRVRLARHHAHVDTAFRGWNDAWLAPAFPAAFELRPMLSRIAVPVLLIQGESDPYGSLAQVDAARRLLRAPLEVRLLAGVRHAPHLEAAAATGKAIEEFCAGVLGPARPL